MSETVTFDLMYGKPSLSHKIEEGFMLSRLHVVSARLEIGIEVYEVTWEDWMVATNVHRRHS